MALPADAVRPMLRPGVEFARVGRDHVVLRHPVSGERFECGDREYDLLRLLDGAHRPEDLQTAYRARTGGPLGAGALDRFLDELREHGLIAGVDASVGVAPRVPLGPPPAPLSLADEGGALNHRLDLVALLIGWLFHPVWMVPAFAFGLGGVHILLGNASQYYGELTGLFRLRLSPFLVGLSLGQTLVFMNLPRELAIAAACRCHGGRVYAFGIRFMGHVLPYFHCDTGDATATMSRRGRWTILTVGLCCQWVVGGLAAVIWRYSDPGSLPRFFGLVLVPPCVIGLVLHAIIFIPMDGYKILGAAVGAGRLRERGIKAARDWLAGRVVHGPQAEEARFWLVLYGLGYYLWRGLLNVLIFGVGGAWLVMRFDGAGALFALGLLIWWHRSFIGRVTMVGETIRWLVRGGGKWWIRWPIRLGLVLVVVLCGFIPYNHEISGECRLLPVDQIGVRAQVSGEVAKVHVREGDAVQAGDLLVTLNAREEKANLATTRAALDKARANLAMLRAGNRAEDIANAKQEVQLRTVQLSYWEFELGRLKELAKSDTASQVELHRTQSQRDFAEQQLLMARTTLDKTLAGARKEEIDAAAAEVARLEAELAHREEMVSLQTVRTPLAGHVVTVNVAERIGQHVQPGDLMAVVYGPSRLEAEVAADELAATAIRPGAPVNLRLWGLPGCEIRGRVRSVSPATMQARDRDLDRYRTDREWLVESRETLGEDAYYARVHVEVDPAGEPLVAGMTGYARIIVEEGVLWQALARPVYRFFEVEVWSWLP